MIHFKANDKVIFSHKNKLYKVILLKKYDTTSWITFLLDENNDDFISARYKATRSYLDYYKLDHKYLNKTQIDVEEKNILRRINFCDECFNRCENSKIFGLHTWL